MADGRIAKKSIRDNSPHTKPNEPAGCFLCQWPDHPPAKILLPDLSDSSEKSDGVVGERNEGPFSGGLIMGRFMRELVSFLANEDGPTSVEYAVMLALIVVVCLASIASLGSKTSGTFSSVETKIAGS